MLFYVEQELMIGKFETIIYIDQELYNYNFTKNKIQKNKKDIFVIKKFIL